MSFSDQFFEEVVTIASGIDKNKIEKIVDELVKLRNNKGRLFVLGVGGSAGNAIKRTGCSTGGLGFHRTDHVCNGWNNIWDVPRL